ncbi:MAG TPA: AbrB/MazE/SpoVT family DNA-binding domain-containing protein [Thermoanaerobaculia bacterium]|jgi:AbrB family looped-hinge helix DNA binding protein|nr:AbrB/MazE/SpoVT family DNA-binding domain-containing protein [Thermoanaerobaculia bacterium]
MQSTVSVRWQTVIPQKVREALNIQPNTKLDWEVRDGVILVHPIPADPVRAARGLFKGGGPTTESLLAERQRERELEEARERRLGIPPASRG